uniref:MBD domain-containing protein n=1 Tax=Oryza rufipogon TaxID=4529 RepID=A0A0E0QFM2_ORYRU
MDYSNSSCSRTRGGLVRLNNTIESNEVLFSKTRSGLVRINSTVESNEVSLSKTRSGLIRGNTNVRSNEGSYSTTRSELAGANGVVDSNVGDLCSKTRSGLVRGNTTVAASNGSYSATPSRFVRGNIIVGSKEGSCSRTRSGLVRESIQMDYSDSSCSRTRSGLVRRKPFMVQVKDEAAMNGLSDDCLKEDSPGKNEPNHKSNLVENSDKPVMKGPDGWWKEGMLTKNGSKYRSDPVQTKGEACINGLPGGQWKENSAEKNVSNHKNELVQRKDDLIVDGLPDGWWKEDRPRKNGSNLKTDPYYIDPVSGYEFRSLKDVHRFLKSGDIYKCIVRPRKRTIQDPYTIENQSHTATLLQHTRPGTADKAIQCELLTSEGLMLPWEEQLSPYRELNNPKKMPELEGMIASQKHAYKVDAPREKKSFPRKRKQPSAGGKPKKHKIVPAKMVAMPVRASPRLASLKITHDLNTEPEDEPIGVNLVNEVQSTKENPTDKSRLNQAGISTEMTSVQERADNQLLSSQADTGNHIRVMEGDTTDSSQLRQADTVNQILTDQENAVSQLQSSHTDYFVQIRPRQEYVTNYSQSQLSRAATVNQIETNQRNMSGQLQSSQADSLDQIQTEQESSASRLQSSQADSFNEIQTIQEYITEQSESQVSHANQIQIDLGNTVDLLPSSQADAIFQMETTQEYITNQSQSSQADIVDHMQVNQDNTANQFHLRQADTVNRIQTMQESTTDQPQLIQALTVNQIQVNGENTANHVQSRQADTVNHIQVIQDNTANQFQFRRADTVNKIQTMQDSTTDQPRFIQALTVNQIQANGENTANYLQPNYAENNIMQVGFSLTPEPEEAPATSFWRNVANQELPVSMQTDGKPVVSSALNVEYQNVPATAPAQPTRAPHPEAASYPSGLAVPSLFGNSWSDPCIEFAFKTLRGDIPVLDDTSAVEQYFPQHDLNKPPSPDYSASPSCFSSSFDNTTNFTQVDHASLPAPNPSDKLYNGGWFPPK